EADISNDPACVNSGSVDVTAVAIRGNQFENDSYKVYYWLITQPESTAVAMTSTNKLSGLAPITQKIDFGHYLFRAQDPLVSTRFGAPQELRVCGRPAAVSVPVPLP